MRRRLKSASRRDVHDGHGGLQQQLARASQPHLEVVVLRHTVQVPLEQALDLPARQPRRLRDLLQGQRLLDVLLHELRDPDQAPMRHTHLRTQGNVLAIRVLADSIDDELLRDQLRDLRTQLHLDEVQHEIERRRAAGAGEAVAVDGEQLIADPHPRELLAQRRKILPMYGGAEIVEQARPRQRIAAGTEGAQRHPSVGQPAQRREQRRRYRFANVDAAADEEDVDRAQFIQSIRRGQSESATGIRGPPVHANEGPFVDFIADQSIGHSQRLERVGHGDQRIVRQGQKCILAFTQYGGRFQGASDGENHEDPDRSIMPSGAASCPFPTDGCRFPDSISGLRRGCGRAISAPPDAFP
jgi:hypothetical protein